MICRKVNFWFVVWLFFFIIYFFKKRPWLIFKFVDFQVARNNMKYQRPCKLGIYIRLEMWQKLSVQQQLKCFYFLVCNKVCCEEAAQSLKQQSWQSGGPLTQMPGCRIRRERTIWYKVSKSLNMRRRAGGGWRHCRGASGEIKLRGGETPAASIMSPSLQKRVMNESAVMRTRAGSGWYSKYSNTWPKRGLWMPAITLTGAAGSAGGRINTGGTSITRRHVGSAVFSTYNLGADGGPGTDPHKLPTWKKYLQ